MADKNFYNAGIQKLSGQFGGKCWSNGPRKKDFADLHYIRKARIRRISDPYFPTFGQNTDQKNSE